MKSDRCRIVPLPDHQVRFEIDGQERLRWHYGPAYPRPFFYPLLGPSGHPLTRMGHPGAPNHDHHRSVWFAHHKVLGIDFWGDNSAARIRQLRWLAYQDGQEEALMAVELGWFDGHDRQPLVVQELITAVQPQPKGELLIELHSRFRPRANALEFQKTNYGFLAVRVAKSMSAHFGDGKIINSEQRRDEAAVFGQPAAWVDYSGSVGEGLPTGSSLPTEGITYFDHPDNPGFPNRWHVREDGWMNAAICFSQSQQTTKQAPLTIRHLLHLHRGALSSQTANQVAAQFAAAKPLHVRKANRKHEHFRVTRAN